MTHLRKPLGILMQFASRRSPRLHLIANVLSCPARQTGAPDHLIADDGAQRHRHRAGDLVIRLDAYERIVRSAQIFSSRGGHT